MNLDRAINIDDLRRMAKRRLPRIIFDFIEGGVEAEEGLAHNENAFRRHRMVPRYLVDVSARDQSTTLFGRKYDSPFGIAPTGLSGLFRRGADLMFARAATEGNIPCIMSSVSTGALEASAKIAPDNLWLQIYPTNDRSIMLDQARRAHAAGIGTLVVTIDVPMTQKRERNIRNGFARPIRMTPAIMLESMLHPAWVYEFVRHGGIPMMENWIAYSPPGSNAGAVANKYGTQTPSPSHTWKDLEEVRRLWPGKLVIKGVLHPDDAVQCLALGADGIYVSNHGGRQLDRAPAPIEVLPSIRAAVGPNVAVLLDSGIRRGADVLLARCLGADMCFVGRATMYGVVAGGLGGAQKAITILREEIDLTLGALGYPALSMLGPHVLFDSEAMQFEAKSKLAPKSTANAA
jgi:L-lactate dehydrogenase (cytochrome)/(S)-mandelate dehydrogenase